MPKETRMKTETQIRNLVRELRELRAQRDRIAGELHDQSNAMGDYALRATKAETEVAEWKKRFDVLLSQLVKEREREDER